MILVGSSSYSYWAKDRQFRTVTGVIEANSQQEAMLALQEIGYKPWRIQKQSKLARSQFNSMKQERKVPNYRSDKNVHIRQTELSTIMHQLASLLEAGLTLDKSLAILSRTAKKESSRQFIHSAYDTVRRGEPLSVAWHEGVVGLPNYTTNMLKSGEASGKLESVLSEIAGIIDKNESMKKLIISSLTYPALLLVVSLTVVALLVIFAVPQFELIFSMWGSELPYFTKILISFSNLFKNHGLIIGSVIIFSLFTLGIGISTNRGKKYWDKKILQVPFLGSIIRDGASARVFHTASVMMQAGVAFSESLKIASGVSGNLCLTNALLNASHCVENGALLSRVLSEEGIFPDTTLELVGIGEETGDLAIVLEKASALLGAETKRKVEFVGAMLEPVMIVIMAIVVGFVVMGILLPVVTMMDMPL